MIAALLPSGQARPTRTPPSWWGNNESRKQ